MIRDKLTTFFNNKNLIMLLITITYIIGILANFYERGTVCAFLVTIISILLIFKNVFSIKKGLIILFMFYFGFLNALFQIKPIDSIYPLSPTDTNIEGQILTIPNSNDKTKAKFFMKVSKIGNEKISGKILVSISDENGDFSKYNIGNFYKLNGKLRTPFKSTNPSQFDYSRYLRNFKIYTVFYAENDGQLLPEKLSPKWKFLQDLNNLRGKIIRTHATFLKSPNLEILGGVVFGDDAIAPPESIKVNFIHSGLLHILAASGMNVAFIFGFWYFILFKLLKVPYKPTVISGMGLIVLYTLMTGLGASVIRAALMLLFILAGKLIDRDAHSISLLSLVALLMLIYNPAYINDVGFQLSFLVTLGLLTTGSVVFEKFKTDNKIFDFFIGSVTVPIVAQIWVAPIQMFYFNTFSLYSMFANILSVPFISVISFGGFFSSILAIFTPISTKICFVLDLFLNFSINGLLFISNTFANLPNALLTTTHPSIIQVVFYFGIVLFATAIIKFGIDKKNISIFVASIILLTISTIPIKNNKLEVVAFDVQNADCFLIKSPQNKYFIIDSGKSGYKNGNSQAKIILLKYLKDIGIKNIETLVVTHFDNDHSGGTVDILTNLNVKNIYINTFSNESSTSKEIYKTLKTSQTKTHLAENDETIFEENNFKIQTYFANMKGHDIDNENSIVTLISSGKFDMLFMGDGNITTFEHIKKYLPHNIEVLKVGHHGGKNVVNQEFLECINNGVSIISTGINKFGHPTDGTLDVLRKTKIYRTDKHHAIKISTDGKTYTVLNYNPIKREFEKVEDYATK